MRPMPSPSYPRTEMSAHGRRVRGCARSRRRSACAMAADAEHDVGSPEGLAALADAVGTPPRIPVRCGPRARPWSKPRSSANPTALAAYMDVFEAPGAATLATCVRKSALEGVFVPILFDSSSKHWGGQQMFNASSSSCPAPLEIAPCRPSTRTARPTAGSPCLRTMRRSLPWRSRSRTTVFGALTFARSRGAPVD